MKAVYCPYCGGRAFRSRTAEFREVWPTLAPDGGFAKAVRETWPQTMVGAYHPTRPCAYRLLGFETLKDLEFRNREGEFKQETTLALSRRSRRGSRRFCPSGMHSRRSSSPTRGAGLIPGRAFSCWISRGDCSASRSSERHTGISLDRARRAVCARTGNVVAVWAASRIRLVFC